MMLAQTIQSFHIEIPSLEADFCFGLIPFSLLLYIFLLSIVFVFISFLLILGKLVIATSTIYLFGLLWLGMLIGWDKPIFELGAEPFLLAEMFKILLLTLITKQILKIRSFII